MEGSFCECPLCFHKSAFPHWTALCQAMVSLTTRSYSCILCGQASDGLDKYVLHLVSHDLSKKSSAPPKQASPLHLETEHPPATGCCGLDPLDAILEDISHFVQADAKDKAAAGPDHRPPAQPWTPDPTPSISRCSPPTPAAAAVPSAAIDTRETAIRWPCSITTTNSAADVHLPAAPPSTEASPASAASAGTAACMSQAQCHLCGWNFDNENFLKVHKMLMHSNLRSAARSLLSPRKPCPDFVCRECPSGLSFRQAGELVQHLREVHQDQRFVCSTCGKLFKLRGSLLVHERVVHQAAQQGQHDCKVCHRKFANKYRRDVHQQRHNHSRPFECGQCGMAFELSAEHEHHLQAHLTEHKCHLCARSFYTNQDLALHVAGHLNTKHLTCTLPADTVATTVPQPAAPAQPGPDTLSRFRCQLCEKSFKRESHLNQHVRVHENKQWECEICKKTFTTKYFLKKHKRLHTGETPYGCHLCGKAFTFQQSYHKHMLYHTDEKPYSCSQCGRAFKELSTLQNHERIHSGERPFACETCGKSFRQRVSYLVHRRIHTGVMPYSCELCGRHFRYKVTQRTHKCGNSKQDAVKTEDASERVKRELPMLPEHIRHDLERVRKAQGRKLIHDRLQNVLMERSHLLSSSGQPPLARLQQLSLSDVSPTWQPCHNAANTDPGASSLFNHAAQEAAPPPDHAQPAKRDQEDRQEVANRRRLLVELMAGAPSILPDHGDRLADKYLDMPSLNPIFFDM